jgi:hypothetical protein
VSKEPATSNPEVARWEIITTARQMLSGEVDLVEGCRAILKYRNQLVDPMDSLFLTLEGVESETDDFPTGRAREAWDPEALHGKDQEKEEYLRRARAALLEACKRIISALGN